MARSWLSCQCMRTKHKNGVIARRSAKAVGKKTGSRVAALKALPGRAKRFVKGNPVRVALGAVALGFVVAKLKTFI